MRRTTVLLLLCMLLSIVLGGGAGAGAQPVDIENVDEGDGDLRPGYNQTLNHGEGAAFHWWLWNDGQDGTVHVVVDVLEVDGDWEVAVEPSRFELGAGEGMVVELTAQPEKWSDGESYATTVRFVMVAEASGETDMVERTASAQVVLTDGTDAEEEDEEEDEEFLLFGSIPFDLKVLGVDDSTLTRFLFQFLLWMVVAALVAWIINPVVSSFAKRTKTKVDDLIVEIITWPVFLLVLIYGTKQSLELLVLPGRSEAQLVSFFNIISFLIVIYVIYKLFKDVLIQVSLEFSKTTDTDVDQYILVPILEKVGIIFIFIITMIYILSMVGIDPSALMAGSVVIGMVLGFALQDTLSNFFAGIILTIDQPFRPGEVIILENGDYCRIDKVGMRSVKMYNLFDHEHIIMPNNVISSQMVVNASKPDMKYKVKVSIGVAYGTDAAKVERILKRISSTHPDSLKGDDHKPFVRMSFGDSSIDFTVTSWVDNFNDQWRVAYEIRRKIYDVFAREDIEIPFPQRDLRFRDPMSVIMDGDRVAAMTKKKPSEAAGSSRGTGKDKGKASGGETGGGAGDGE